MLGVNVAKSPSKTTLLFEKFALRLEKGLKDSSRNERDNSTHTIERGTNHRRSFGPAAKLWHRTAEDVSFVFGEYVVT
jgi:hypothetical protein